MKLIVAQPEDTAEAKYEERVLAYIDVLGWKELVKESVADPTKVRNLDLASQYQTNLRSALGGGSPKIEATHFSDLVVISSAAKDGLFVLEAVQLLCEPLLSLGHYTRGAIVVGDLVHRPDRIFGPALIEAYKIERKVAKYPRIIVQPAAISLVDRFAKYPDVATKYKSLRLDSDGLVHVDILGHDSGGRLLYRRMAGSRILGEDGLRATIRLVKHKIVTHECDLGLMAKDTWMLNYLEDVLEQCSKRPEF